MKRTLWLVMTWALIVPAFMTASPPKKQVVVTVGSVEEFVQAIKSNTEIKLLPGRYNLSEAAGKISTANVSWEGVFDGQEMVLTNLENLTISGKPGTELVVDPRYAWVLKFEKSKNITLRNLTMGHTEKGSCVGGVVAFESGSDLLIENSVLYGSGTEGIRLDRITNFTFKNSVIKECTYDLMTLSNAQNAVFTNSAFLNTGEFDMIIVEGTGKISFNGCTFRDCVNEGYNPYFFSFQKGDASVKVQYCQFINNQVEKFSNQEGRVKLLDNVFKNNEFVIPK